MNYRVVDFYEGKEVIGKFDTYREAYYSAKKQYFDTDGECSVEIQIADHSIGRWVTLEIPKFKI